MPLLRLAEVVRMVVCCAGRHTTGLHVWWHVCPEGSPKPILTVPQDELKHSHAHWNWLAPRAGGASMPYAWDEPLAPHKLRVQVRCSPSRASVPTPPATFGYWGPTSHLAALRSHRACSTATCACGPLLSHGRPLLLPLGGTDAWQCAAQARCASSVFLSVVRSGDPRLIIILTTTALSVTTIDKPPTAPRRLR